MGITNDYLEYLIRIAKRINSLVVIDIDETKNIYKIHIYKVSLKEKFIPIKIYGLGTTVNDAAYDYVRLSRGFRLIHDKNNKWIDII